ncbi:MAG TPA: mechanosensitive ion channel domain-containing protein [Longimicrobiaceae bacterium]|jgi:small-conductance mechanosensitive channel
MQSIVRVVGPERTVEFFGVRLLGMDAGTGRKLLLTAAVVLLVWLLARLLKAALRALHRGRTDVRARFWADHAVSLSTTALLLLLLVSIWFDDPGRLAVPAGLLTAGLAVALQRVITAVAGYFVILSGRIFDVGDRITMSGVRGDVIALGFTRTKIMEMGQPPSVQEDEPAMWVGARQYTGRIVTVTNDKIFDEPVYNYTREFPFIWEELRVPVRYESDRQRAEAILLEAARRHTAEVAERGRRALQTLSRRYFIEDADLDPRVFLRLTDNWLELTVRFLATDHGVRALKDAISRDILAAFVEARIEVASATYEIVGVPPLRITGDDARADGSGSGGPGDGRPDGG